MKIPNPLEAVQAWITHQPDEVKSTIHFMVGLRVIDCDKVGDVDFVLAPKEHFDRWMQEKIELRVDDVVSASLHVRELIQFFVIDHFGSRKQWENITDFNASMADEFRGYAPDATMVENLDGIVRSAPFRQKLWERTATDWNSFVADNLTNGHLLLWKTINGDTEADALP